MPGRYTVTAGAIATGSDKPIINLEGGATMRHRLYDLILGSDDTPADQAVRLSIERTTDAGTGGSALTETPLDPADPASGVTSKSGTYTTPPASGVELMLISLNQRATFRWVAAPGSELVATAAAADGLELLSVNATSTHAIEATMMWIE